MTLRVQVTKSAADSITSKGNLSETNFNYSAVIHCVWECHLIPPSRLTPVSTEEMQAYKIIQLKEIPITSSSLAGKYQEIKF